MAVIGPNADDVTNQLGDWTAGGRWATPEQHPRQNIKTVLDGVNSTSEVAACAAVKYFKYTLFVARFTDPLVETKVPLSFRKIIIIGPRL